MVHIPYSLSVKKCDDASCYASLRTPLDFCATAVQRQPTPRNDPSRPGHFLRRGDALQLYGDNPALCAYFSDLPSMTNNDKMLMEKRKARTARDMAVTKNLKLKSWEAKKAKGILKCYHYNKPRCYFLQEYIDEYKDTAESLLLKMESISFRCSCSNLVFDDDYPVSKVLGQRVLLTCESPVEKAYYNHQGWSLKLPDSCIH